jgi:hypothetical protein
MHRRAGGRGGVFSSLPAGNLIVAHTGTISSYNNYVSGTAVVAERSSSQSQCQYFPGVGTICGDSSYDYNEEEYYRSGIGPVGYHYYNTFSDCGGGFCSGATWRHNAGLSASSFTGAAYPLRSETEANDSPATAQTITTANPIVGSVSQSTYANLGNTVIYVTVTPDGGSPTAISPTVEDWYTLSIASARTVVVTLSFEGSPTADLDMFLTNSSGGTLYGYSVHDNPARQDQNESISVNLAAGTYRIGIDGFITPSGPISYTLYVE